MSHCREKWEKINPIVLIPWQPQPVLLPTCAGEKVIHWTIRMELLFCFLAHTTRSRMNVVFRLPNESLQKSFLAEAEAKGFIGIAGHRDVVCVDWSKNCLRMSSIKIVWFSWLGRLPRFTLQCAWSGRCGEITGLSGTVLSNPPQLNDRRKMKNCSTFGEWTID